MVNGTVSKNFKLQSTAASNTFWLESADNLVKNCPIRKQKKKGKFRLKMEGFAKSLCT